MTNEQSYRASIWAIIIDKSYNFLFVKLASETNDRWDFVKWWMNKWENEIETLNREIKEELWVNIKYKVLKKSSWYFVYDWPLELQIRKWYRWQIRQNYWLLYNEGNVNLDTRELSEYKWVSENNIQAELIKWGYPEIEVKRFIDDYKNIKKSV
jgi:8-oxo-dGTP pyrophosphatase MutT (NUDIX family)